MNKYIYYGFGSFLGGFLGLMSALLVLEFVDDWRRR